MTPDCPFQALGLPAALCQALAARGYTEPTPIQAQAIPALLSGADVLGQAQTGTGKTAAFALPALARIALRGPAAQVLVLAPTRELAAQVAQSFVDYGRSLGALQVASLCGGEPYGPQRAALRGGAQVVVGTPGRVCDHLARGELSLAALRSVVLDEADEMLRMGFIADIESILNQAPPSRQLLLFSATMAAPIRRIAERHLVDPQHIAVATETASLARIRQRAVLVDGMAAKTEALARFLTVEPVDAAMVFVRTKASTAELAAALCRRGLRAAALSGDMAQRERQHTVAQLRGGAVDVLVATDVAARGLDVARISHVFNYDSPHDPASYVHRIGRTGRAGRSGEAIVFLTPRERRCLKALGRATGAPIEWAEIPTAAAVNALRVEQLKSRLLERLSEAEIAPYRALAEQLQAEQALDPIELTAALAHALQGEAPLWAEELPALQNRQHRPGRDSREAQAVNRADRGRRPHNKRAHPAVLARYRIEVGARHKVKPGNIVGAIANEAGLNRRHIGRIEIAHAHSFVELPRGLPKALVQQLRKVRVAGQPICLSAADNAA